MSLDGMAGEPRRLEYTLPYDPSRPIHLSRRGIDAIAKVDLAANHFAAEQEMLAESFPNPWGDDEGSFPAHVAVPMTILGRLQESLAAFPLGPTGYGVEIDTLLDVAREIDDLYTDALNLTPETPDA